mmetsp:Transcript_2305/g.5812  ORF Transcript_2305/g.5812 Transcript_2305/m.5812 type:complete len:241 (+) Transcript_2305:307-1029(+)
MPRNAPPARNHELCPPLCVDVLHVLHLGRVGVPSEPILLEIGSAEGQVPDRLQGEHRGRHPVRQLRRVVDKVPRLHSVGEGDPGEVSEEEHEAKPVVNNVHGRQDSLLKVEGIGDVNAMEEAHHGHRVRHVAVDLVLLACHGQVNHDPAYQSRVKLAELFEVKLPQARVQLTPDEEVIDGAPGVSSLGAQDGLRPKRRRVQHHTEEEGCEHRRRDEFNKVVVDVSEDGRVVSEVAGAKQS